MNTAAKGKRKEDIATNLLKAEGWNILFKSIRFRFGCRDFGPFDIVAYKDKERKYISVKHFSGGYFLPHQQEIKDFKQKYGKDGESYELWIWAKPHWEGRGKNKIWKRAEFLKVIL